MKERGQKMKTVSIDDLEIPVIVKLRTNIYGTIECKLTFRGTSKEADEEDGNEIFWQTVYGNETVYFIEDFNGLERVLGSKNEIEVIEVKTREEYPEYYV
jgi:hypothetical protein